MCHSWREETFPKWYKFSVGTHACLNDRLKVLKAPQGWQNPNPMQETQEVPLVSWGSRCASAARRATSEAGEDQGGAPGSLEQRL